MISIKRVFNKNKHISRQYLANPFKNLLYHERLVKAGVVNIKNNSIIKDLGNGYGKVEIIDKSKFVK
ncbi:hypothetical protein [Clostridium botulinum]|uniref:hypothetical protein n=1 Tax=Clostridium botulinum TaxID=1491 RepID=UPI0004B64A3C|nr:hypothetical protein [Clostridium botulinum]